MTGLFSTVLFAALCESQFFANIMTVVLLVWLYLVFTAGTR
jgi:hypothetical protein